MQLKKLFNLSVHDTQFSKEELVINPEFFPHAKLGDLIEISSPDGNTNSKKLFLEIKNLTPVKGMSASNHVAKVTFKQETYKSVLQSMWHHCLSSRPGGT